MSGLIPDDRPAAIFHKDFNIENVEVLRAVNQYAYAVRFWLNRKLAPDCFYDLVILGKEIAKNREEDQFLALLYSRYEVILSMFQQSKLKLENNAITSTDKKSLEKEPSER